MGVRIFPLVPPITTAMEVSGRRTKDLTIRERRLLMLERILLCCFSWTLIHLYCKRMKY